MENPFSSPPETSVRPSPQPKRGFNLNFKWISTWVCVTLSQIFLVGYVEYYPDQTSINIVFLYSYLLLSTLGMALLSVVMMKTSAMRALHVAISFASAILVFIALLIFIQKSSGRF